MRSDAFLFVYDITNPESLHMLDPYMTMTDIESEHRQDTGQVPLVKIVAGNKCDLPRAVSAQQGLQWAHARGCGFMETSALEQVNIEETFLRMWTPLLWRNPCPR